MINMYAHNYVVMAKCGNKVSVSQDYNNNYHATIAFSMVLSKGPYIGNDDKHT